MDNGKPSNPRVECASEVAAATATCEEEITGAIPTAEAAMKPHNKRRHPAGEDNDGLSRKKQMRFLPRAGPLKYILKGLQVPDPNDLSSLASSTTSSLLPSDDAKAHQLNNIAEKLEHSTLASPPRSNENPGRSVKLVPKVGTAEYREHLKALIERSEMIKRGEYKFPPKRSWDMEYDRIMKEKRARDKK